MKKISQNKKAVSNLVAYVLLITMAIALSILIYGWLRLWVPKELLECPEGVNLIISEYECSPEEIKLNLTNKGFFTVDGFYVRVHNETNASLGLYNLYIHPLQNNTININEKKERTFTNFTLHNEKQPISNLNKITLIEVQPFIISKNKKILCPDYTSIKIDCASKTCSDYPDQCGTPLDDGCGGNLNCECDPEENCVDGYCETCIPKTCSDYSGYCEILDDGCGGNLNCECTPDKNCVDGVCKIPGGTPNNPFRIFNCQDLQNIDNNLSASYILINDIDCTNFLFKPIGRFVGGDFKGTLDGDGYRILNLSITCGGGIDVGLFDVTSPEAEIKNLGLNNSNITGGMMTGGLVGLNRGTISNSYSTGNVTGGTTTGGLVGLNRGTISNSYSTGKVTGGINAGGFVGQNQGTISNSYSTGDVISSNAINAGGLIGQNSGTISNSYSTGDVISSNSVSSGGLIGQNQGTISNSYSTGNVTGGTNAGGFAGVNHGTISNSYSTGNVTSSGIYIGGFVGRNEGTISNSFYHNHAGNPNTCFGSGSGGCTPIPSSNHPPYFYNHLNLPMSSWDFTNIWQGVPENYPILKNMPS